MSTDSSPTTTLDRGLLRALQLAPRAPFAVVAGVLGVSEQTVARRYRVLHDRGVVRVAGVLRTEALGQTHWLVRIRCKPQGAESLALALAQRADVGWVNIYGGAVGVVCSLRARSDEAREDLLIDRLPRSGTVLDVSAAMTLHTFAAALPSDWIAHELSEDQERRLREAGRDFRLDLDAEPDLHRERLSLDGADWAILDALTKDGRASYVDLGRRAGISAPQARRRLQMLLDAGVIFLDVDIAPTVDRSLGAHLWITAEPGAIPACGTRLAELPHTAFVAAMTGTQNLVAAVRCSGSSDLYRLVTEGIGAIPGIVGVEVSPHLRTVKQAGPILLG